MTRPSRVEAKAQRLPKAKQSTSEGRQVACTTSEHVLQIFSHSDFTCSLLFILCNVAFVLIAIFDHLFRLLLSLHQHWQHSAWCRGIGLHFLPYIQGRFGTPANIVLASAAQGSISEQSQASFVQPPGKLCLLLLHATECLAIAVTSRVLKQTCLCTTAGNIQ